MMAQPSGESSSSSNILAYREDNRGVGFHSKHKIFLSHSGAQKDFVEQLCVDLERWDQHPFFDKRRDSLPVGENFPQHIFEAIGQCQVGVVILSEEFFTRSKWPMIELVVMVREAKKRELGLKIVPMFLGMSIVEFRDSSKRDGWRSCWHELALMDNRIDVQEWVDALKYLEPLNGMVYDGLGEVKFRKEIVDVLCGVVPLETRMDDSHIQGRSRLCKVIQERIDVLEKEKNGVVVVGLYGVGGIGKTSICKALCNEYVGRFRGRVCHAELERKSKEELLRDVLKRLIDTSHELLEKWNKDELLEKLKSGMIKEPIFLAVDNVSDDQVSINEAKCYVLASLPSGSIMLVTSRSKETLKLVRRDLVDKRIMEMPELDVEEARSLFCKSYEMESSEIDERVIMRCVERCYFRKGDGNDNYHYHPLTLNVLSKQLASVDVEDWEAYLDKIDGDIFNGSGGVEKDIFSILRKSYDMLTINDRLLFMDVALFLPFPKMRGYPEPTYKMNTYEWLGIVHEASVHDVVCGLKRLRRKSLLENLGDGMGMGIGMHDLWRSFCKAEGQSRELRDRCWWYGAKGNMELIERCPAGGCWENVTRMAFLGADSWNELGRVNFSYFPNVLILKISWHHLEKKPVFINLSRFGCLKSLDIRGTDMSKLVFMGLPRCLVFLRVTSSWDSLGCSEKLVKEVGYLTKLEHLHLVNYSGNKFLEMRSMVSLRVATFYNCVNVVTLTRLSTKLWNLRVLHIIGWSKLQSCHGVSNLVGLEDLIFWRCRNLKRLPNLGKMRNLRKLVVNECPLISEVPGLDDLVALEELHAGEGFFSWGAKYSFWLPDMSKLKKLRVVRLYKCQLEAFSGFDSLVSLEELEAEFGALVEKSSLRQLTNLQTLYLSNGWHLQGLIEVNNLVMLRNLKIEGCFGVDNLPDMQGLTRLEILMISLCGFKGVGGLSNLIALESLKIKSCDILERVPDLQS